MTHLKSSRFQHQTPKPGIVTPQAPAPPNYDHPATYEAFKLPQTSATTARFDVDCVAWDETVTQYVCAYIQTCIHMYTCIIMYMHVCMCMWMAVHAHVHIYRYMIYVYDYTYMCIHMYICIHAHTILKPFVIAPRIPTRPGRRVVAHDPRGASVGRRASGCRCASRQHGSFQRSGPQYGALLIRTPKKWTTTFESYMWVRGVLGSRAGNSPESQVITSQAVRGLV